MAEIPAHREQAVIPTPAITTYTEVPEPKADADNKKKKSPSDKE